MKYILDALNQPPTWKPQDSDDVFEADEEAEIQKAERPIIDDDDDDDVEPSDAIEDSGGRVDSDKVPKDDPELKDSSRAVCW